MFGEQITEMVRPDSYLYGSSQRGEKKKKQRYGYGRKRCQENFHKSQSKDIGLHFTSVWLCSKKDKYASFKIVRPVLTVNFLPGSPSPLQG